MEKVIVIISLIILLLLGIKHIIDQYKYNPNISRVLGIFTVGYSVLGYLLMKRYDNLSLNTKLNLSSVVIVFLCLYFLFIGSGKKEDGENINEIIDNKTSNKELFWAVVNYSSKNQSQILENKGFIICLLLGVVLEIIKYFIK